jgi:CubicO group peptidase (beta-lactamase class C family)
MTVIAEIELSHNPDCTIIAQNLFPPALPLPICHIVPAGNSSNGPITPNTTSFSIALFSTENNSSDPYLWQYRHTAPSLSISTGVKSVDADSVYRIGTLTQLFTVYTILTEAGDVHWEEPVTKWIPELAQATKTLDAKSQPLRYVDWDDVTLVASHLSGIARDCESQLVFGR